MSFTPGAAVTKSVAPETRTVVVGELPRVAADSAVEEEATAKIRPAAANRDPKRVCDFMDGDTRRPYLARSLKGPCR